MRVIYYQSEDGNFGDDLNAVLWRELLPPAAFDDDDAVLLGIGSIFRDDFLSGPATQNKRVFVLGSGAGTGPLPVRWPNPDWSILAVRGPLSARLIGRPDTAITDGAALLSVTRGLWPEPAARKGVVFIPHHNSLRFSRWREVCDQLGLVFVDTRRMPGEVLHALAGARLAITEAMHGAIAADTLRIPWIPVVCSPEIEPFKWTDWTSSLDLPYLPRPIPPSSAWQALKHRKLSLCSRSDAAGYGDGGDGLIADFHRRFGDAPSDMWKASGRFAKASDLLQRVVSPFDAMFAERAAEALHSAAKGAAYLSGERVLANRVERLQEAVISLRRALAV